VRCIETVRLYIAGLYVS